MTDMREAAARGLCELHIRTVRRHDTPPDELEAMLPGSVDYAWRDFIPQADAVISTMLERLRTPSEGVVDRGAQEFAMTAQRPYIAERNAAAIWQAMLAQFEKENSHEQG